MVNPGAAFDKTLIWTSSNKAVATVTKYGGKVTPVAGGTAVITARAIADGQRTSANALKAVCAVTVAPAPVLAKSGTYNGHTYRVYKSNYTWQQANTYVKSKGWHLAAITGSAEQTYVSGLVSAYGHACWLGANNLSGAWRWTTGESFRYTHWDSGEPSGTQSSNYEYYLGIYGNSTQTVYATGKYWNDFANGSGTVKGFVVETP